MLLSIKKFSIVSLIKKHQIAHFFYSPLKNVFSSWWLVTCVFIQQE